jgi:hypothetical protein
MAKVNLNPRPHTAKPEPFGLEVLFVGLQGRRDVEWRVGVRFKEVAPQRRVALQ